MARNATAQLRHAIPKVRHKMLAQQLHELERDGLSEAQSIRHGCTKSRIQHHSIIQNFMSRLRNAARLGGAHAEKRRTSLTRMQVPIILAAIVTGCAQPPKETHVYKTADGIQLKADVHHPSGTDQVPALIWIHGGGLMMGSRVMASYTPLRTQLHRYLQAGFAVIAIDYRLAPETKLDSIIQDVRDAIRWIRSEAASLHIDDHRLVLIGHSAGAYLALLAGLTEKMRAIVSWYGYGEISGEWYTEPDPYYLSMKPVDKNEALASVGNTPIVESPFPTRRYTFYVYCRQQGLWPSVVTGFDWKEKARDLTRYSVLRQATESFPPTLFLHGSADLDVPYSESERLAERLKQLGVSHKLLILPGKGHGFDEHLLTDTGVSAAFDTVITFLRLHISP